MRQLPPRVTGWEVLSVGNIPVSGGAIGRIGCAVRMGLIPELGAPSALERRQNLKVLFGGGRASRGGNELITSPDVAPRPQH
jgi:hypothetical protein